MRLPAIIIYGFITATTVAAETSGHFVGQILTSWDKDGVHMTLQEPFGYVDSAGRAWPVPKGMRTDGASIPRALWTLVGSPLTGKYRSAAVIHDYYCDFRSRPWRAVDQVFFEAMITAGVPSREARLLYIGVVAGGPRWDPQASHNVCVASAGNPACEYYPSSFNSMTTLNIAGAKLNKVKDDPGLVKLTIAQMDGIADNIRQRQIFDDQIKAGRIITLVPHDPSPCELGRDCPA